MVRTEAYTLGTLDPSVPFDVGAGPFASERITAAAVLRRTAISDVVGLPTMIFPGPNATRHMRHYLNGTGLDYTIDLEGMLASVPRARRNLLEEFRQAKRFVERLPIGRHFFTSIMLEVGYNYRHRNTDWYYAMAGYSYWGKGQVIIAADHRGKRYDMSFEFKPADRYNWDGGKDVTLLGVRITDEDMGELHLQGLAREFNLFGAIKRHIEWSDSQGVPEQMVLDGAGRR